MLFVRIGVTLVAQHLQSIDQPRAGFVWFDDIVYIAASAAT